MTEKTALERIAELEAENTRLREWDLALNDAGFDRLTLAVEARDRRWEALRQAGETLYDAVAVVDGVWEVPSLVAALSGWRTARAAVMSWDQVGAAAREQAKAGILVESVPAKPLSGGAGETAQVPS